MNKNTNCLLIVTVIAVLSLAVVVTSDSTDATETHIVTDGSTLDVALGSATPGDTILFKGEFELNTFRGVPNGVNIVAGTMDNNQSYIVATTIVDGKEMIVGCHDVMNDYDFDEDASSTIEGLDNIILTMAPRFLCCEWK